MTLKFRLVKVLLATTSLCLPSMAAAQIVSANGSTQVYTAPNGVQVVDIAKASQSGLSHNKFEQYNVPNNGVVLNNGTRDPISRQSQLAGQVTSNLNLDRAAKVILNEVVGPNRSVLSGYTEVVGSAANVIVANPYGVTCTGCGFINTPNVQITTGRPNIDANGNLQGFAVTGGDILITGNGLDASGQDFLALVARKVRIEANINAKALDVVAGVGDWNSDTLTVTARKPKDSAPDYAIDSSALGGMYANRIRLIATEAGVGVRALGDVAATAGDFTINAAGKIELAAKASAQHDIRITSSGNLGITLDRAALTATRDIRLSTGGALTLNGGSLIAGRDLALSAAAVSDSAAASALVDANRRHAGGSLSLAVNGTVGIDGASYGGETGLAVQAGSLNVGSAGASLYSNGATALTTTGNMALSTASLKAVDGLSLTAGGVLSTEAGTEQAILSTHGGVILAAGDGISNAGAFSAEGGDLAITSGGFISNSGLLQAKGSLSIGALSDIAPDLINTGSILSNGGLNLSGGDIDNQGRMLTSETLFLHSASLANSGTLQALTGSSIDVGTLINSGTLIGSDGPGRVTLSAANVTNSGTLQSGGALSASISEQLNNTGKLLATGDLSILAADSARTLQIGNGGSAYLQSGGLLTIAGTGSARNVAFSSLGGYVLADSASLTAGAITNDAFLQTSGSFSIDTGTGAFVNKGTILARTTLALTAASLANDATGQIQGSDGATFTSAGAITNAGTLILGFNSGKNGTVTGLSLTNSGTLQSAGNLTLGIRDSIINAGVLLADDNLAMTASDAGHNLTFTNSASAIAQAGSLFSLAGTASGSNSVFQVNGGGIRAGTMNIRALSASNAGQIQSLGAATFALSGAFSNSNTLLSQGLLTLDAASISNSSAGKIQSFGAMLAATSMDNDGSFLLASDSGQTATLTLDMLDNSGALQSAGNMALALANSLTNSGSILTDGNIKLQRTGRALGIANAASGGIRAQGELDITGGNTSFSDQSGVLRGDTLKLSLASLTNNGIIQSDGAGTVTITGSLTNNSGKLIYLGATSGTVSTLSTGSVDNYGILQSSGNLTLNSSGAITNRSSAKMLTNGDLTIAGTSIGAIITNAGTIRALGALGMSGVNSGSRLTSVRGQADSLMLGGTVTLKAGTLYLDDKGTGSDGGGLASTGGMTLNVGALDMDGLYSYITAASSGSGLADIAIDNGFTNKGLIYSAKDLKIAATAIVNNSGAGLAANGTMTLNSSGDIANYGSLYTGSQMVLNAGHTIRNYRNAAMDSDGSITATGDKFVNNSNVNAKGNITITTNEFRNEVEGGDTRVWSYAGTSFDGLQTPGDQDNRSGAHGPDHDGNGEDHSGVLNWHYYEDSDDTEISGDRTIRYHATFQTKQSYSGGKPNYNPKLIADGTMTIQNFQNGYNLGGIISATTLNITTNKSGATFRNDNLAIIQQDWKAEWNHYRDCDSPGIGCGWTDFRSYDKWVTGTTTLDSVGGGVYAGTLNASGFGLTNAGSPYDAATTPDRKSAHGAGSLSGGSGNLSSADFVSGVTGATKVGGNTALTGISGGGVVGATTGPDGQTTIDFVGVSIIVPTSPNGLYVVAKDPTSKYLIETNPRFTGASGGGVGSDFIAQRLGINPDDLTRRLGNAAYESYLIQQQIAGQTGAAVLQRGESNDQQVQRLMNAAADQAQDLGLTYGKALTDDQAANLKQDMVWMVETQVNGEKVLAPIVYLSAATKSMFDKGDATIAANEANMNLTSLTNTGGTIEGSDTLSITSQSDITNTSGMIKGGDVSLTSTDGSIVNQTLVSTAGREGNMTTDFGKSAGIESTGALSLDAKKDIAVSGATVTAGGDASLKAGQDITFTSIQDKTSTSQKIENGSQTTTTIMERGSGLSVGGDLAMESGGDTTFKASEANIAGNADIRTGGDFNILAGQNSTETQTETSKSGVGVGGGVWGKETTTTDEFQGRNVASNFNVGGDMSIDSEGDMTVQGSNVNVGGNADVKADSVNILQGNDVDRKTSTTETETYLRTSSGTSSGTSTYAGASASAGGLSAQASAGAGAEAHNSNQGDLELYNKTTTTTTNDKNTAVGSSFNVGGNANIQAENDVTLQGSELNAGGDVNVDAQNINLLAAENKDVTTTTTNSTSVGFMVDNNNSASADAGASASASLTAQAQAEAEAEAESDTTVDLVRNTQSSTTTTDITHTGSSINSGGSTSLTVSDQLKVQGSSVDAAGDVNLSAKDMSFEAVNDVHEVSTTSQTTRAGLYVNGNAEAKVGAEANMTGASAGASAGAEASAGINVSHESSSSVDGYTTAQTSSIKAGGNMTRTAENGITDVGTDIEAGGDFTQTANTWDSKAAADTTYGTSSSQNDAARIGAYADAEAGASAGAGMGGGTGADADASVGVKASYEHEDSQGAYNSSTAKVSNIKARGNFSSTTTDKTSMEGTNVDVAGNADLTAGSLDYTAARNTESSSSSSNTGTAEVKVGVSVTKAVKAEASGGYGHEDEQSSSSQAVVGGFSSGGNLNIKTTKGDANFEGTNISADGDGSIQSAGSVNFNAARDEASSSSNSHSVAVGVSTSTKGGGKSGGIEAGGGFSHADAQSSTANAGSFTIGGNMTVSADKDANFEGTNLNAGGDANVNAAGDVNFKAAESTSSSHAYGAELKVSAEAERKGKKDSAAGGSDGAADKPSWKSATPTKKDGGKNGSDSGSWHSASPSKGGDKSSSSGNDSTSAPSGDKDGPTIGSQRGKTNDNGGSTDAKPADKMNSSKIGAQREKPPESKSSDGTEQSGSSESKPTDKTGSPKIGAQREKKQEEKNDGSTSAKPTKQEAKGNKWQSAKPSADKAPGGVQIGKARAEAPEEEKKPADDLQKKGGAAASFDYKSETSKTYQGSTITSGGNVSINASGNVSRENVKTNAEGTQTTRAGGAISDKTVKDQKDVTAVNGSLEGKSTSADTGTGSADNAGDTGI